MPLSTIFLPTQFLEIRIRLEFRLVNLAFPIVKRLTGYLLMLLFSIGRIYAQRLVHFIFCGFGFRSFLFFISGSAPILHLFCGD